MEGEVEGHGGGGGVGGHGGGWGSQRGLGGWGSWRRRLGVMEGTVAGGC